MDTKIQSTSTHEQNGKSHLRNGVDRNLQTITKTNKPSAEPNSSLGKTVFSLDDLNLIGVPMRSTTPKLFIGLGGMSSRIVHSLGRCLIDECGRLPGMFEYLNVDADAPDAEMDSTRFVRIANDGVGTDPRLGRKVLSNNRSQLKQALESRLDRLFGAPDALLRVSKNAFECTSAVIIAGSGGCGGGGLDLLIDLFHECADTRGMRERRMYVTIIGPEISVNDITRVVTPAQREYIPDTFAQNIQRICWDIANENPAERISSLEPTLDNERVFSVQVLDQRHSHASFARASEFEEMVALSLFCQHFTVAGMHFDSRLRDFRQTDAYAGFTH
jgi:hypothetical protein